jgi:hypothetical protein
MLRDTRTLNTPETLAAVNPTEPRAVAFRRAILAAFYNSDGSLGSTAMSPWKD